jgi:amidophosphoribosyltransferase
MGGFFGVTSWQDCSTDLFYGTDYHSHLGTKRGGLAVIREDGFVRVIHNIENAQFRSKFDPELADMRSWAGIGVISDTDDQPVLVRSHLGSYAIATVGAIKNAEALARDLVVRRRLHFTELSGGLNPTELAALLIDQEGSFEAGISSLQDAVEGSCSLLILTEKGIYAARDKYGRTPVIIGRKEGSWAVTMETCAFPNLDFKVERDLGPGEIAFVTPEGVETRKTPGTTLRICWPATGAGRPWPVARRPRSISWRASPTPASATAWASRPRPRSRSSGLSSSTRRPGPAASCPRTRMFAIWSPG